MRLVIILILLPIQTFSQTYVQYRDSADVFLKNSEYEKAGVYYEMAFSAKFNIIKGRDCYSAAVSWALSNNLDKAIEYIQLAYRYGYKDLVDYLYDPNLSSIRESDPFQLFLKRIKDPNVIYAYDILRAGGTQLHLKNKTVDLRTTNSDSHWENVNIENDSMSLIFEDCDFPKGIDNVTLEELVIIENEDIRIRNSTISKLLISGSRDSLSQIDISNSKLNRLTINRGGSVILDEVKVFMNSSHKEYNSISFGRYSFWRAAELIPSFSRDSIPKVNSNFSRIMRDGFNIDSQSLIAKNVEVSSNNDWETVQFYGSNQIFNIESSKFECVVHFEVEVSNHFTISESIFSEPVSFRGCILPEFTSYIPFRQFGKGLGSLIDIQNENCPKCYLFTGNFGNQISQTNNYELLLNDYQRLYNNYRYRGELESANSAYVLIKDLTLKRFESQYLENGGFGNYFRFKLAQLMKLYTNHGTDPSKALLISFYLIIVFSLIYFFFPSEWDKKSKTKLVQDYKTFIQKNDHGYVKPFFVMLAGFGLSLINALTLSLNAFVTLGFGTIPTTGLARYVCVIQGFIGWFLLSIFTVALINQVLA